MSVRPIRSLSENSSQSLNSADSAMIIEQMQQSQKMPPCTSPWEEYIYSTSWSLDVEAGLGADWTFPVRSDKSREAGPQNQCHIYLKWVTPAPAWSEDPIRPQRCMCQTWSGFLEHKRDKAPFPGWSMLLFKNKTKVAVCSFTRTGIAEYHQWGNLNNRNVSLTVLGVRSLRWSVSRLGFSCGLSHGFAVGHALAAASHGLFSGHIYPMSKFPLLISTPARLDQSPSRWPYFSLISSLTDLSPSTVTYWGAGG